MPRETSRSAAQPLLLLPQMIPKRPARAPPPRGTGRANSRARPAGGRGVGPERGAFWGGGAYFPSRARKRGDETARAGRLRHEMRLMKNRLRAGLAPALGLVLLAAAGAILQRELAPGHVQEIWAALHAI